MKQKFNNNNKQQVEKKGRKKKTKSKHSRAARNKNGLYVTTSLPKKPTPLGMAALTREASHVCDPSANAKVESIVNNDDPKDTKLIVRIPAGRSACFVANNYDFHDYLTESEGEILNISRDVVHQMKVLLNNI